MVHYFQLIAAHKIMRSSKHAFVVIRVWAVNTNLKVNSQTRSGIHHNLSHFVSWNTLHLNGFCGAVSKMTLSCQFCNITLLFWCIYVSICTLFICFKLQYENISQMMLLYTLVILFFLHLSKHHKSIINSQRSYQLTLIVKIHMNRMYFDIETLTQTILSYDSSWKNDMNIIFVSFLLIITNWELNKTVLKIISGLPQRLSVCQK